MAIIRSQQIAGAGTASLALTASYIDAANIDGLASSSYYQSFTNQSTWTVQHNLNASYVLVQTYDQNNEQLVPHTIDLIDQNTTVISFDGITFSGTAVISVGSPLAGGSGGGSGAGFPFTGSAGILGSLAVNGTTTSTYFIGDGSGLTNVNSTVITGSVAGANKDIQFNLSGGLGAVSIPGWFSFNRDLVQFTIGRNPVIGSSANYSIYSGENNILNSRDTIISGENNLANGIARGSFINGRYNTASAAYSLVTGKYNYIATDDPDTAGGFATGFNNRVLANYGVALGFQGLVVGNSGVTVGQNNTASFYGLACGDDTYAAFAAVSTGNDTRANSRYTLTGGSTTRAGGDFADLLYVSESAPTGSNEDTSDVDTNQKWYQPSTDTLYIYVGPSGFGTWVSQNDYSPYITVTHYNTSNGLYTYPTFSVGDSFLPYVSGALQARSNYGTARFSHAEGSVTTTFGRAAHAEGIATEAAGWYSHTEGNGTRTGNSFTRGAITVDNGPGSYAHAEGIGSVASGRGAHAQGYFTYAIGTASFSSGLSSYAWGDYQAVFGKYNDYVTSSLCLFIIGNGSSTSNRNNLAEFWTTSTAADNPHGAAINFSASLAVKDFLTIRPRTTTPATPVEGMIIASGSAGASKLYYYDGTSWNALF